MKKLFIIMFFLVLIFSFWLNQHVSAKTYYVSFSEGNDKASGLYKDQAWKSIERVNYQTFFAGDSILFKRGDSWLMSSGIVIKNSGKSGKPIYFGAYGKGAKPVFYGKAPLSGWNNTASWTNSSENIWVFSKEVIGDIQRLWLSEIEAKRSSNSTVSSTLKWYHSSSALYVYSEGNPATTFSNIEYVYYTYGIESTANSSDYITIQNLDIQSLAYPIALRGVTGWTIDNCEIGYDGSLCGVYSNGSNTNRNATTNIVISNCILNTNDKMNDTFDFNNTYEGISINKGADNWDIHDCVITGWGHAALAILEGTAGLYIKNIKFHDNIISAEGIDYGRGFLYNVLPTVGMNTGNEIYNNYFYACGVQSQISGDGLMVYNNIFDATRCPPYKSFYNGSALNISAYYGKACDNKIYNNIFANNAASGIWIQYSKEEIMRNQIKNNIFYNNSSYDIRYEFSADNGNSIGSNEFQNNLFYNAGDNKRIFYEKMASTANRSMTVEKFNEMGGITISMVTGEVADIINNNIFGDPQFVNPDDVEFLARNYHLQSNSQAISAGVDVNLPYDYDGYAWLNPPNIGPFSSGQVKIDSLAIVPIRIFPNPAKESISITFDEPLSASYVLRIISYSGKLISEFVLNTANNNIVLPLRLCQGIYILQFLCGNQIVNAQLLIIAK